MTDTSSLIQSITPAVAACSYLIAAMRLATFRRGQHRFRRGISLLASVLVGTLLCAGLEVIFFKPDVSVFQSALAFLFCTLTLRVRGNLATMIRMQHDSAHAR